MAFVRAMYKKGAGKDKQGKDAGNRMLCPYRNFSQAIKQHITHWLFETTALRYIILEKLLTRLENPIYRNGKVLLAKIIEN